jgi:tetratricopeptide (TPR) repeat protein
MAALPKPPMPDGPLCVLFDALHELHHVAGWPSLREMAREVGCSRTTISAAFSDPRLPRWGLLELIVETLGGDTERFHTLWLAASDPDTLPGAQPSSELVAPRELPADVAGFTGRSEQLAELDRLLEGPQSSAIVISAVSGTAGVGKTALAVHWAHRVAHRFPDGQLYQNLRGYDRDKPVQAADALEAFLRRLGVDGSSVPSELAERAARYRSLLAGKRMLIVLDNAHSMDQVRDLLPGASSCFVVVTTRDRMPALVARYGAVRVNLDLLPPADALALLGRLVGPRVAAEPRAAEELVQRCARLPLALRVAAELAAVRPAATLAELAAELADESRRLDLLAAGGDEYTAVRAVFSWSCRHLSGDTNRAFQACGLHPGSDFDVESVAALAGLEPAAARSALGELVQAHLVEDRGAGRFAMHDLLRVYAAELAADWPAPARRQAMDRLIQHYHAALATADTAWLDAERDNLLAIAAAACDWPRAVNRFSAALAPYLDAQAHYSDAVTLHGLAAEAARRGGDRHAEAVAVDRVAQALYALDRYSECLDRHEQALTIFQEVADRSGEASTRQGIAWVLRRQGRCPEALEHQQAARAAHHHTDDRSAEARDLSLMGVVLMQLGRYPDSFAAHAESLRLLDGGVNLDIECRSLNNMALLLLRQGHYAEASSRLERALDLARELGARVVVGVICVNLADVAERQGRHAEALRLIEEAYAITGEVGRPVGRAECLRRYGRLALHAGRVAEAVDHLSAALEIADKADEKDVQTSTLLDLGEAMLAAADPESAAVRFMAAIRLAELTGDPYQRARGLTGLGAAREATGGEAAARILRDQARSMFSALGVPDAKILSAPLSDQRPQDGAAASN